MTTERSFVFAALAVFVLVSCGPNRHYVEPAASNAAEPLPRLSNYSKTSDRVTIMTWNLENLFDTEDDPKVDDDTFLPLEVKKKMPKHEAKCKKKGTYSWVHQCLEWDWNEYALKLKMQRLSEVIRSVNNGRGPDILVVEEIENFKVLDRLNKDFLKGLGYTSYLQENGDYRGIDVGILTRLKVTNDPYLQKLRSRPGYIMQVALPDGERLNVIGVHFPIAPTPIDERLEMVKYMIDYADARDDEYTLAAGDFNFPKNVEQHYDIINKFIRPFMVPAHLYCKDCVGTFYDSYDRDFSFLDMVLMSKNFFKKKATWTLDVDSVQVYAPLPFQWAIDDTPADFDLPDMSGVSDHWPIVLQIVKTN
ncbi:MAG: endonuclease/exonuclease/phosphatase family protein [Bdellovibrionales bacterium]|nr:endonuclease/exonuclease/phosphatase family protein [Bdellovibrionales bacterium]